MASKRDQRRPDLGKLLCPRPLLVCDQRLTATSTVIPYQEPLSKGDNPELSSTLSQTLPMAAIFMRNRYIGWYVTSTPSLDPMPRLRRHLSLGRQLRKGTITHAIGANNVRSIVGQPWSSASRTGWARAKTVRRAAAHPDISQLGCP